MKVLMNNQPCTVQPEDGETLGHLFMRLEDLCHQKNLTVVNCSLDGESLDIPRQQALSPRNTGDFEALAVEVVDHDNLLARTLSELRPLLVNIPPEAEAAAAALQAGRSEEAHATLHAILQVWAVLFETLDSGSRLHGFTLAEVSCNGSRLDTMVESLSGHLREIEEAFNRRDTVSVADVLEYEISPAVPVWIEAVDSVIAHLAARGSGGAPR